MSTRTWPSTHDPVCPRLGRYVFSEEARLVGAKCDQSWLLGQVGRFGMSVAQKKRVETRGGI